MSDHGLEQGYALGKHLVKELESLGLPPIVGVYTSPLLRCRQTAAQARKGILHETKTDNGTSKPGRVCVEMGLVESINESWFRSWAGDNSDGTWGFKEAFTSSSEDSYHPKSLRPAQEILNDWCSNWKPANGNEDAEVQTQFDLDYASLTAIDEPYRLSPRQLESAEKQRERMRQAVNQVLGQRHSQQDQGTVLFLSHGAPVTHLFASLTGRPGPEHGSSSYCCYSIYKINRDTLLASLKEGENTTVLWDAVQVNQAKYLHETIVSEVHI